MDAASVFLALAPAAPFAAATVAWEVMLHRRTIARTTGETREVKATVITSIADAKADRDKIRGEVAEVKAAVSREVAGVSALVAEARAEVAKALASAEDANARAQLVLDVLGVTVAEDGKVDATENGLVALLQRTSADVRGVAQRFEQMPQKGAFAHGQVAPEEAREKREEFADAAAAAEEAIRAKLCGMLGEELGEIAFAKAKANAPAFKRAVKAVASGRWSTAQEILAPTVGRYQVQVTGGNGAGASSASPGRPY